MLSVRKLFKFIFIVIVLISCIKYIIFLNKSDQLNKKAIFPFKKSIEITQFDSVTCSPLNLNRKNFFIKLDNQIYPKSLPLYLNNTIDFECLNSSKNTKL